MFYYPNTMEIYNIISDDFFRQQPKSVMLGEILKAPYYYKLKFEKYAITLA